MFLYVFCNFTFAAEFGEIWSFVEWKLKVLVPPYIKYVLKYCGYDSCHTISTIEEPDFEYFEAEVRKGGIINFFEGEVSEKNVLEGSTKCVEEFEIRRGHRTLLRIAVKLIKERLDEYGVDGFYLEIAKKKKPSFAKSIEEPLIGLKISTGTPKKSEFAKDIIPKNSLDPFHEELIQLKTTLLAEVIRSLSNHSSEMYKEVCCMEIIIFDLIFRFSEYGIYRNKNLY